MIEFLKLQKDFDFFETKLEDELSSDELLEELLDMVQSKRRSEGLETMKQAMKTWEGCFWTC